MAIYLKEFENHTQYENYINGSSAILPNVSICTTEGDVHYNPYVEPVETRVVAKFNVTNTSNPTRIIGTDSDSPFSAIEIDGVVQPSVVSAYKFSTRGEHTVKYTLTDPTSIDDYAFHNCSGLTSIVIPDSVTSIGESAFDYCESLTRLNSNVDGVFNLPSGVTSIGQGAFHNCSSLTSITIPDSVTSINNFAFEFCSSLTSIVIPSGVTSIGEAAFYNCSSLTSIAIPNSVTSIDYAAFCGCPLDDETKNKILAIGEYAFECSL